MHNGEIKRSRGSANKRMHLQWANWHSPLMEGDRQRCTSPNRLSKWTLVRSEPSSREWEMSLAPDPGKGALHPVNCPETFHDRIWNTPTNVQTTGHSRVKSDWQRQQNEAEKRKATGKFSPRVHAELKLPSRHACSKMFTNPQFAGPLYLRTHTLAHKHTSILCSCICIQLVERGK